MPHGGSFKDLAKIVSGSGRHVEQAHDCVAKWCNCRFVHSTFNTITFRTILQPIDADHFFVFSVAVSQSLWICIQICPSFCMSKLTLPDAARSNSVKRLDPNSRGNSECK